MNPGTLRPLAERFAEKIDKAPGQGPWGDCWLWTGYLRPNGYGQIGRGRKGKGNWYAHRVAFELHAGRPPGRGFDVCHRCDVRACVNPSHLFEGTRRENLDDMTRKGRRRTVAHLGEEHHNAKLSTAQAAWIKASVIPATEAAEMFGVSVSLVGQIRRGAAWRHLPDCTNAAEHSKGRTK